MYTYGVAEGRITPEKLVEVLCANPAKLYGCYPRKGVIREGADADIVVYDPAGEKPVRAAELIANVDYNPYEGFRIRGGIEQVYLRGSLTVDRGRVLADRGGSFVFRGLSAL